jgi:hypothetical protein
VVPTQRVLQGSLVPPHLYGQVGDMTVYSYGSASPLLNIARCETLKSNSIKLK